MGFEWRKQLSIAKDVFVFTIRLCNGLINNSVGYFLVVVSLIYSIILVVSGAMAMQISIVFTSFILAIYFIKKYIAMIGSSV